MHLPTFLLCASAIALAACGSSGSEGWAWAPGSDLGAFETKRISVGGVEFEVWIADTPEKHQQGFMRAAPGQLAPLPDGTPRGMLFVFPSDQAVGFIMTDTWVPLDLAWFRSDGLLVEADSLTPHDDVPVFPGQPIRYALEVNAGDLAAFGVGVGDSLSLPLP